MSLARGSAARHELFSIALQFPVGRRSLLVMLGGALSVGVPMPGRATDAISLPPWRREFASPDGRSILVVETLDGWKTPRPRATLRRAGATAWTMQLPHHHGPRFALVADDGHVLFVDEWINVTSRQTLLLLDATGGTMASHDHDAVRTALGAGWPEIRAMARLGTWISAPPVLAADQRTVRVPAAGRTLIVDLADGQLSARAP